MLEMLSYPLKKLYEMVWPNPMSGGTPFKKLGASSDFMSKVGEVVAIKKAPGFSLHDICIM